MLQDIVHILQCVDPVLFVLLDEGLVPDGHHVRGCRRATVSQKGYQAFSFPGTVCRRLNAATEGGGGFIWLEMVGNINVVQSSDMTVRYQTLALHTHVIFQVNRYISRATPVA